MLGSALNTQSQSAIFITSNLNHSLLWSKYQWNWISLPHLLGPRPFTFELRLLLIRLAVRCSLSSVSTPMHPTSAARAIPSKASIVSVRDYFCHRSPSPCPSVLSNFVPAVLRSVLPFLMCWFSLSACVCVCVCVCKCVCGKGGTQNAYTYSIFRYENVRAWMLF